jgi:hypothetical protein
VSVLYLENLGGGGESAPPVRKSTLICTRIKFSSQVTIIKTYVVDAWKCGKITTAPSLYTEYKQRPHTILDEDGRKCQKSRPKPPHTLNSQACDANVETMNPARPLPHTQRLQCFCHLPSASSHLRSTLSKTSQTSGRHVRYFWRRSGNIISSIQSAYRNSRTFSTHMETRTSNLEPQTSNEAHLQVLCGQNGSRGGVQVWTRFKLLATGCNGIFLKLGSEADHSH